MDVLTARCTTGVEWMAADVVETHESMSRDLEDKHDGDVSEMRNYLLFS